MTADHLIGIEQFEADLWKVADNLRANSNLASNEYFMPILHALGLSDRKSFRERYLLPALEHALVEMIRPESPTARNQRYRLTASGRAVGR